MLATTPAGRLVVTRCRDRPEFNEQWAAGFLTGPLIWSNGEFAKNAVLQLRPSQSKSRRFGVVGLGTPITGSASRREKVELEVCVEVRKRAGLWKKGTLLALRITLL